MRYRRFGRTGWQVSEVGYGMWGMGGWTGSDDEESLRALDRAFALGCNFFDTAWAYGQGKSETLLGEALRAHPGAKAIVATKIPPKNMKWPGKAEYPVADTFPADHIREYTEKSLRNLGVPAIDLQQFHVWSDAWADDAGLAARRRRPEAREAGSRVRHQRQPLGAGQRAARARDRPRRQRAGGLQRLRPGAARTSCSRTARRTTSRSSRACRSTRAA